MSETVTVPGVKVTEPQSLSIGISAAPTAVPVFIFNPFLVTTEMLAKLNKSSSKFLIATLGTFSLHRVESWSDYLTLMGDSLAALRANHTAEIVVAADYDPQAPNKVVGYHLAGTDHHAIENYVNNMQALGYYSLMHYFENGGGACYFCLYAQQQRKKGEKLTIEEVEKIGLPFYDPDYTNLIELVKNKVEALKNDITALTDVTLLCLCGDPRVNSLMHDQLNPLMSASSPLFCLTSGDQSVASTDVIDWSSEDIPKALDKKTVQSYPPGGTTAEHTAAYFPYLKTRYTLTLDDLEPEHMLFDDYVGPVGADRMTPDDVTKQSAIANTPYKSVNMIKASDPGLVQSILSQVTREIILPPTAAIAGLYCRTDNQRGVWKAPANVVLSGVKGLCDVRGKAVFVTDDVNEALQKMQVNVVRYFKNQGHVVWGARTRVAGADSRWRYVPVRRLFDSAERNIREAMKVAVFEPNTPATWSVVRTAIDSYLHDIWSRGGLAGDKPDQAWYVHLGVGLSMSAKDVLEGKMIVRVGMAPVKPAEFVVLEFSQLQAS